jgi:hypothetical protein
MLNHVNEDRMGDSCLDADSIAALADGAASGDAAVLAHVASCARCRERLASATEALNDQSVQSELTKLERGDPRAVPASRRWLVMAGLAAAAALVVVIGPLKSFRDSGAAVELPLNRDPSITSSPAPRIVSPTSQNVSEPLRWTSVPHADLYRIRVWNPSGDVVWSTESRDTMVAVPRELAANTRYLWEVEARTGWDRWVTSDLVELTLRDSRR